jgi:hypothetical protein
VVTAAEPVDALDLERGCAHAVDPGTHRHEHLAEVHDLGLPRRVVDRRRALGEHRGHHDVLGRPDAREVEPDLRTRQLRCLRDEVAVCVVERRTEPLQAHDVQVEGT